MSWASVTLGEVSTNIQTGPFGSQLHQSDYSDGGVPVVMPKDLVDGHISEDSIARVSMSHVDRLSRHKIEVGDILYSRRGDVGRCAFATEVEQGWLCGTGCLRVTIDQSKAIPKFIFYQLQKTETIGWVEKHAVGSTMLNLNTSILESVPIKLPSVAEQQMIVHVLSAYDDLIENNQKQIKLLEEAAQRLYKEWFVDLRFPGHENVKITDGVPEGWHVVKLFSENLSTQDIRKIKAVAVELLQKVKSKIAELDHWTDKQETRSIVYNLIRDDLWSELPACYDEPSISVYLQRIYEYVYKRYKEVA